MFPCGVCEAAEADASGVFEGGQVAVEDCSSERALLVANVRCTLCHLDAVWVDHKVLIGEACERSSASVHRRISILEHHLVMRQ